MVYQDFSYPTYQLFRANKYRVKTFHKFDIIKQEVSMVKSYTKYIESMPNK